MVTAAPDKPRGFDAGDLPRLEAAFDGARLVALRRGCARFDMPYPQTLALLATAAFEEREMLLCKIDRSYFINTYCTIYDSETQAWIPFALWETQERVLAVAQDSKQFIGLKARQLGMTWLFLAIILHDLIFCPIATDLIFNRREDEALYLISEERLRGMFRNLPAWMRPGVEIDSASHFKLTNGSSVYAFPSNGGDGYTGTRALIDEADLIANLKTLLGRVKPTIDAGGQIAMISRPDKDKPESLFKSIYEAARDGRNAWTAMFLPWHAHPGRTQAWYEQQCRDALANEGTLDSVWEQYPATDTEALAARTLNLRIPPHWIDRVFERVEPLLPEQLPPGAPTYPDLKVYRLPEPGRKYVQGLDPAEGNPTSDDSALTVLDRLTGEQMCELSARLQPEQLAAAAAAIGVWYNNAPAMVERNNHGHAVLLWLKDNARHIRRLNGYDRKAGWNNTTAGKSMLYDDLTNSIKQGDCLLHSEKTKKQLRGIQGSTLRAPEGERDDAADACALANVGRRYFSEGYEPDVW